MTMCVTGAKLSIGGSIFNSSLCTSNKSQHTLTLFNGNQFRHTASSIQVN